MVSDVLLLSYLDITGRPLLEMSGLTSGCENSRVHRGELDSDNRVKTALASEMDVTGVSSTCMSHAPRIRVRHRAIRAPGVPGAIDARRSRLFFSKRINPAVG